MSSVAHADFAMTPSLPGAPAEDRKLISLAGTEGRLYVVGERGLIAHSDDGGITWVQNEVPVSSTLTAITLTPNGTGFAVGHGGVILRSAADSTRWETVFDGTRANQQFLDWASSNRDRLEQELAALEALEDVDPDELADAEIDFEDALFAFEDAEVAVETGPADPFLDVLFTDDRNGLAVGAYGMLYRTEDGGDSWSLSIDAIDNIERFHLYSLAVDPGGRLHASGEAGLLFYSDDGGKSWTRSYDVYDGSLFAMLVHGEVIYTIGLRGNVFRSNDRGLSWDSVALSGTGSLYSGATTDDGGLIFVGTGGRIVSSSDRGASFSESTHPSRAALSDVVVDGDSLYLTSLSGFLSEALEDFNGD
ncbi:MAG: YCF48-related protein [Pseudomonadota bacterium]